MTKRRAWFFIGVLAAMLIITPIVSIKSGPDAATLVFLVLFVVFCYGE